MPHDLEVCIYRIVIFLFFLPYWMFWSAIYVPALGILWFPFAALAGIRAARHKGMNIWRTAGISALYSIASLITWFLFRSKLRDRNISDWVPILAYFQGYGAWLYLMWAKWFLVLDEWSFSTQFLELSMFSRGTVIVMMVTSAVAWVISLMRLLRYTAPSNKWWRPPARDSANTSNLRDKSLSHPLQITPFAFSTAWVWLDFTPSIDIEKVFQAYDFDHLDWRAVSLAVGSLFYIFWTPITLIMNRIRRVRDQVVP